MEKWADPIETSCRANRVESSRGDSLKQLGELRMRKRSTSTSRIIEVLYRREAGGSTRLASPLLSWRLASARRLIERRRTRADSHCGAIASHRIAPAPLRVARLAASRLVLLSTRLDVHSDRIQTKTKREREREKNYCATQRRAMQCNGTGRPAAASATATESGK